MFMEERHMSDDTNLPEHDPSRRDFHRLTLAAIGGLMAGLARPEQLVQAEQPKQKGDAKPKKPAKEMKEIHVCRGLNSCKGQGIDWDFDGDGKLDVNACAGQGACATAKHVSCNGENDCKGQGGCGNTAGINDCKGQGKCHVPLTTDTWKKARARFEARMKSENEEYGEAPSLIRKQSGNKQSGNSNGNKPSRKKKP
jgi:hypothetical protein